MAGRSLVAQQANKAQPKRLWQQGCRRDAVMQGKEPEDVQPHARTVLSTATVIQLFGRDRENSRISRRAVELRGQEMLSAPGPSSAAGHCCSARCFLFPSRRRNAFTPCFFPHHPGLFGKSPGLGITSLPRHSSRFPPHPPIVSSRAAVRDLHYLSAQ